MNDFIRPGTAHTSAEAIPAAIRCDNADRHPTVAAVQRFSRDVLVRRALQHDDGGVPADVITALGDCGVLNHLAPSRFGGAGLDSAADRRIHEHLAYGCVNTWLIWAQHAPIVGRITRFIDAGGAVGPWAERVLRGEVLAGAGISDVRRYPHGHLSVARIGDEWIFDGRVSWVSGWGLNQILMLAGVDADTERVITALVPVSARTVATTLPLRAVGGSHTTRVHVDHVAVPSSDILAVEPLSAWRTTDREETSDARAPVFGVIARVLDELGTETAAAEVVSAWKPRVATLRSVAYELAEEAKLTDQGGHRVDERLSTKAAAAEALDTLSHALLLARAGRGLTGFDTAQLHCRAAMFLSVQGQTAAVRARQLDRITAAARAEPSPAVVMLNGAS